MAEKQSQSKTAGLKPCLTSSSSELFADSPRRIRVFDCRPEKKQVRDEVVDASAKSLEEFLEDVSKVTTRVLLISH